MSELHGSVSDAPSRELRLDLVRYQNAATGWVLKLSWTVLKNPNPGAVTGMQLYLDSEQKRPAGKRVDELGPGPGTWSQIEAGYTLIPGQAYWIAVIDVHGSDKKASNSVPVLWQPLRLTSLTADADASGEGSLLDLAWQPPPPPFTGYEVGLTSADGQAVLTTQLPSLGVPLPAGAAGAAGRVGVRLALGALPLPLLEPRMPFWMQQIDQVAGQPGLALGPVENAQAYVKAPQLLSARFAHGDAVGGLHYTVRLQIPGDETPAPTFAVSVTADGRPYAAAVPVVARADVPAKTWAVDVTIPPAASVSGGPARVPDGTAFSLHVARADALSTGPGAAFPVPTRAPAVTAAVYDGGGAGLAVRLAQGDDAAALVTVVEKAADKTAVTLVAATVQGPHGTVPLVAEPQHAYTVTAAAVAEGLLGPAGAPVSLLTTAPALATVRYDDETVDATWTPPKGETDLCYALRLKAGDVVVAETAVGGTSGSLPVPAGEAPIAVEVAAVRSTPPNGASQSSACVVEGPACAAVPLPTDSAGPVAAVTSPAAGTTELTWAAVPGATGYAVLTHRAGAPDGPPTVVGAPALTLPQPVEPASELAVAVAAITAAGGVVVTGPAGPVCALPTVRPGPGVASYDGVDVTVGWTPAVGALGYEISVLSGEGVVKSVTAGATADRVTFPLDDAAADDPVVAGYRAVVQARTDIGSGPATDPAPLLGPALYFSTASAATQQPHVFTAVHPAAAPTDLTAALPDLGFSDPDAVLPIEKGPFVLAASQDPESLYPYQLTVLADSDAWSFPAGSSAIREAVRTPYTALLLAAEQAGVGGPALYTLMNAVARILPQTFGETLFYAAGLDAGSRTVDLRPGLVLRVWAADYVAVAQSQAWINGYGGGASFDVEVGGYLDQTGQWRDGFDPFIARLVAAGALTVPAPDVQSRSQSGIAAAADLFALGLRQPYHRLFTPGTLDTPTGPGSTAVASNFVVTAAAKYSDLIALTNPPAGPSSGYFRGRAVITPCARVTVNGAAVTVPLGTTVGGLLDAYAARPASGGRVSRLTLRRPDGSAVLAPAGGGATPVPAGAHRSVRFDWGTLPVYGNGLDALSLPLLPGDRIGFAA